MNLSHIDTFVQSFDLLRTVFKSIRTNDIRTAYTDLYCAVCLLLTHKSLTEEPIFRFGTSQELAYACADLQPVFRASAGTQINLAWLLHVANFFRYHLTEASEGTLAAVFGSSSLVDGVADYETEPGDLVKIGWAAMVCLDEGH